MWRSALLAAAAVALLATPAAAAFDDVPTGHWAHRYVEVLDEEGVVDAYRVEVMRWLWWVSERRFYPDRPARRDAWFTFLARLFGWPAAGPHQGLFRDVGPDHRLDSGEPAAAWLEAAGRAGVVEQGYLWPDRPIERQSAVAGLARALGLEDFAGTLGDDEVATLLGRFRDGGAVAPGLRRLLAAAVRLQVVVGYPDGTLRPAGEITRAEAAAVLARSALVRPRADPVPFSPDGDGIDEEVAVWLQTLRHRNVDAWQATFYDLGGQPVWWTGWATGRPPQGTAALRWHGRGATGAPLAPGTYYLQAAIRDARGQVWESTLLPVGLIHHRLDAWLHPSVVAPGEPLEVAAVTRGGAVAVRAEGPGTFAAVPLPLSAQPGERWHGTVRVPREAGEGTWTLTVRAVFPGTERRQQLSFRVRRPLQLHAWVMPDPVPAGGRLVVHAVTSPPALHVRARFADGTPLELQPGAPGAWTAARSLPATHPAGPSWVDVEAWWDTGTRSERVVFRVADSPLRRVRIVLTD